MVGTMDRLGTFVKYAVVILVALWVLFPLYWVFMTSFKYPIEVYEPSMIPWLQFHPILTNWFGGSYGEVATGGILQQARGAVSVEVLSALLNSLGAATISSFMVLLLGIPCAYGLARFTYHKWKNKDIHFFILSLRFLPPFALIIPFFLMLQFGGLIDTLPGLVVLYTTFNLPLGVVLLRDMFADLPPELEESAMLDGDTRFSALIRVALPLVAPSLVAAFLICFAFAWNELMFALTVTYMHARTMPVIIAQIETAQAIQFWIDAVWVILALLPPMVVALVAQKYIVRGLTLGAVKG
jgi:multiple sugar transport system permease protein